MTSWTTILRWYERMAAQKPREVALVHHTPTRKVFLTADLNNIFVVYNSGGQTLLADASPKGRLLRRVV